MLREGRHGNQFGFCGVKGPGSTSWLPRHGLASRPDAVGGFTLGVVPSQASPSTRYPGRQVSGLRQT